MRVLILSKLKHILFAHILMIFNLGFGQESRILSLKLVNNFEQDKCKICYLEADTGKGNTSVDFDTKVKVKFSYYTNTSHTDYGYFTLDGKEVAYAKRNRDLGQTFTQNFNTPHKIKSLTVRTGWGNNAIKPGIFGQKLSLQWFEVTGEAKVNNNGTDSSMQALHGYPHDRINQPISSERDDYIEGETYKSMGIFRGAVFPTPSEFGYTAQDSIYPNHPYNKGRYLQFVFDESAAITLFPNKNYAFLIMIDSMGTDKAFTLANKYYGTYPHGHGIRREGNGKFPPKAINPSFPTNHPKNRKAIESAKLPVNFKKRAKIMPGTNGYPDVDTWRDFWFCIEFY